MSEEEYIRLLNDFPAKLHAVLNWKKYFERLVHVGRRTGRTDIKIGDDIRNMLSGQLDDRTIRAYLPPSMKHQEKVRNLRHKDPQIVVDPHPPPEQIVEIIPDPEPAKTMTDKQILTLDSRTCKGWPCEKYFTYKIEYKDGNAIRMYSI